MRPFFDWARKTINPVLDKALAWWRPKTPLVKAAFIGVAIAPFAWHYYQKATNPPFELRVTQPGTVPYDIYLVDVQEVEADTERIAPENLRLDKASLLRPFGVIVRFYNLMPKRAYQVSATVEDDEGEILRCSPTSVQSETGATWAYFAFYPDIEKHSPGTWKAKLNVSGVGIIEQDFEVMDLTAEEKESLAQHEEAREQAKLAFSHVWVVVAHQKLKAYTTAIRENPTEGDPLKRFDLIQVAGLDYKMERLHLSAADKLNGLTYRGVARFAFTVYRGYDDESGWTEWFDVDRRNNNFFGPLLDALGQVFSAMGAPNFSSSNIQLAPHMLFQMEKRDGHWWTMSQEEMRFIDGTRHGTGKPAFIAIDENRKKSQLLKADRVFQPTIEFIAKISDDGKTPRAELLTLAEKIEASPDVLKKQQKQTMEALE